MSTPLELMEARRGEIFAEADALLDQRGSLLDAATSRKTPMTETEQATFDELGVKRSTKMAELGPIDERITELTEQAARTKAADQSRKDAGTTGVQTGNAKVTDPPVYARDKFDTSYFRDLYEGTRRGDSSALDRLRRNSAMTLETRALGNTGGAGGSGGEFAPPLWLVDQYVALARPARVAADLFDSQPLPSGVSSINIPKVSTGTTVATQTTQNSALSQTDMATTSLTAAVVTLGGKQVVALQLLQQSGIPFDKVIMEDLALAFASSLDVAALTGAGTAGLLRGLSAASGLTTQTYTQASPTVSGAGQFYSMVAQAISKVYSTRFLAPDTILMHPRRWAWITAAFDTAGRPFVVPAAVALNPIATDDTYVAQGYVGMLQGLQVFTDPNLPINTGAGTNQDPAYVFRRGDIKLWESAPQAEAFDATYADSAGVLFRLLGYAALIPDRYGSSLVVINGTGMITPTF